MRSTILVIAMVAVSAVATAAPQGPQFPIYSLKTCCLMSMLAPQPDLFAGFRYRESGAGHRYGRRALVSDRGFLLAGHRKLRSSAEPAADECVEGVMA